MKPIDYAAPTTLAEAVNLLASKGDRARVLAGGTDLIVQLREGRRELDLVVDIKKIPEINTIRMTGDGLHLGASVPCQKIDRHTDVARVFTGLHDAARLVGGVAIQSRASVGGNLCNGSPAADTIPALIAAGAIAVIAGATGTREVPVEQFCTGPGRTVLQPGEVLVEIRLPTPAANTGTHYLRFIPRNEMDIAVVGVGTSVTLDETGTRCLAARIALGAVGPTPILASDAAAALVNGPLGEKHLEAAAAKAQAVARPISDMRGTADYRKHLVGVLVRRSLKAAIERARKASKE